MRNVAFVFLIIFSKMICASSAFANELSAKEKAVPLSLFQNQIKDCDLALNELQNIKSFSALYAEIQKKYLIISEKTLYRELAFQTKGENRKIKITNDNLEIFKVDLDDKLVKLGVDARHKLKTPQAQVSQLTLNAKIQNDWIKSVEVRENSLKIEIVRVDQKITQIKVSSLKTNSTLDCQIVNTSEVCLCNK